jgi:alpha-ketoglutarate-dependent 2,4-dichlorophenoxyacetate dioxygenase
MPITAHALRPEFPEFAAEIHGIDASQPFTTETERAVRAAMDRFAVCFIRNFAGDDAQHVAFSRLFGELELAPRFGAAQSRMKLPELFEVSNLDEQDNILQDNDRRRHFRLANAMWHTDSSFQPYGASYSLLRAKIVPVRGSNTEFLDMRAAYDALPASMKTFIEGLVVEHSTAYSRSLTGYKFDEREQSLRRPTRQYLVQTHSGSGRKSLLLASHASHIVGMDVAEGRALLAELTAHASAVPGLYSHVWQANDVLIWDNRCTMHRATAFEDFAEKRDLCRTTVVGDLPLVPEDFHASFTEEATA